MVLSPWKTIPNSSRKVLPSGDISPVVEGEIGGPKISPWEIFFPGLITTCCQTSPNRTYGDCISPAAPRGPKHYSPSKLISPIEEVPSGPTYKLTPFPNPNTTRSLLAQPRQAAAASPPPPLIPAPPSFLSFLSRSTARIECECVTRSKESKGGGADVAAKGEQAAASAGCSVHEDHICSCFEVPSKFASTCGS